MRPLSIAVCCLAVLGLVAPTPGHAKSKQLKVPELRIVDVLFSPLPYLPETGPLEMTIEVELPGTLDGATTLEVSSLITSVSKHSLRFLSKRQAVELSIPSVQAFSVEGKPRVVVTLLWDGKDQTTQQVEKGRYRYEIRAKLLAVNDNGPRTHMVSWPKRGTIDVK
jgi:hypothetical protein